MKRPLYRIFFFALLAFNLIAPTVGATENIGIDARQTGRTVKSDMFGANYVFTWNTLTQLENSLPYLKHHTIRYPGGAVAENNFNPVDPFKYTSGASVPSNKGISRYIQLVNKHNWRAVFVVPTARYKNNIARGKHEIENFTTRLLKGDFGTIESGRTIHFEVGNEFYWRNDINADQYGLVAKNLVGAIHAGIHESGKANRYKTELSVQSGLTVSDAKTVAGHFRYFNAHVDYLTYHWYPGRTEIQLGFWRMNGVNQTFSSRLNSIANEWRKAAGFSKPFFLSEYNIRSSGFDHGLKNPMGIMSIFSEAVRGNTQVATVWPLIANQNNIATKLFASNGSSVSPTTNGLFYRWMYDTLRGSKIIEGVTNSSYTNASNFRQGLYTEAFKKGKSTLVVYVFGGESATEQVRLNFSNFTIKSVRAERLHTTPGQEGNESVVAQQSRLYPAVWGGNRKATFTLNSFSQYEVVKMVFQGTFH